MKFAEELNQILKVNAKVYRLQKVRRSEFIVLGP